MSILYYLLIVIHVGLLTIIFFKQTYFNQDLFTPLLFYYNRCKRIDKVNVSYNGVFG